MIDKELEAIFKCHELLKDLDNSTRLRVFKYLLDRYNLVPSANPVATTKEEIPEIISEHKEVNNTSKKNNSSSSINNNKPKKNPFKKSSPNSYSMLPDLNLMPNGKENLKDFFSSFQSKSNFDNNIIILYYLKNIINQETVGVNHIYTAYKHLGIKIPNIRQSLVDTKNRKGWINSSNTEDLQITIHGENYIEHEIIKNDSK